MVRTKNELIKTENVYPVLLMLQAEKLKNRGYGITDYDYVEYYRDENGNIYGFLDEVVITPEGGYYEDYDWNFDDWENEYPDDPYYGGGGSSYGNNTSEQDNINIGRQFINSLQNGDINVILTSDVASGISTMVSVTGLVNTIADTFKEDIGILGKIGNWLGRVNVGYSILSASIGLCDEEQSPRDWVNAASAFFSVGSIFIPALGFVALTLTVAAYAVPGDQGKGTYPSSNGQY